MAVLISACGSSTSSDSNSTTETHVSLPFEAVYNTSNDSINCDATLQNLGISGVDASLEDFRFYIHDISFNTDQGRDVRLTLDENAYQTNDVALIDFQNKGEKCSGDAVSTHEQVTGSLTLKSGEQVTGVRFTVGVPQSLNHQDPTAAPSPLNIPSMQWNWQAGYKFMRLDIAPAGGVTRSTDAAFSGNAWLFHLGSTNCEGDPESGESVTCARPNRPEVVFEAFDLSSDTIMLDYGALVANAMVNQDEGGAPGCMSGSTDPECASIFDALGLDLSTGQRSSTQVQSLFRLK